MCMLFVFCLFLMLHSSENGGGHMCPPSHPQPVKLHCVTFAEEGCASEPVLELASKISVSLLDLSVS